MRRMLYALTNILCLLIPVAAMADTPQPVLDQQQTAINAAAGSTDQWQSFTPGKTGMLSRIDLAVSSGLITNQPQGGTIKIYAGEGTAGTLLATQNVTFNGSMWNTFQSFTFQSPPMLTAGQRYTYRFSVPQVTVGWVALDTANPYPGGRAGNDPNWDYVFKTWMIETAPVGSWTLGKLTNNSGKPVSFGIPVADAGVIDGGISTHLQSVGIAVADLGVLSIAYKGHITNCTHPLWGAHISWGERGWEFYFDTGTRLDIAIGTNGTFTFTPDATGQVVNAGQPAVCR